MPEQRRPKRPAWPSVYRNLLLATVAIAGCAAPTAAAVHSAQRTTPYQVNLPLLFDGAYQGDIPVVITPEGQVSVDVQRFIALLGRRASADLAVRIRGLAGSGANVDLAQLRTIGIEAAYDSATLELRVSIPVAQQGSQTLSAYERSQQAIPADTVPQQDFSATATITARDTYRWHARNVPGSFEPIRIAADLAANIGGANGVYLFAQTEYQSSSLRDFRRGNIVAIHDDPVHAIRYSAGDVAPVAAGFQTSPLIGGVSVERQYGTLQPFRNIRPSGQFSFVLERPSTIDVVVNGATLRTVRLEAGQYDLRDFPFFNGLNQVELYVVDNFGRRLLASFSQYFSARLLDRGIFEFGANAGFLERLNGTGSRYRKDRPAFTGYVRYGLSSSFTAGANLQLSSNQWMGGLEAAWASPIGTVGSLVSISHYDGRGSGHAMLVSYEGSARKLGPLIRPQLNLEFQLTSRNFTPLTLNSVINRYRYTMQGRFATQLPANFGLGLSFSHLVGRDLEPNQTRYATTLSHRIGPVNFTGSFERVQTRGPLRESRALLTMSLPLGRSQSARASYDTRDNLVSVEYARFQRDEVDSIGGRAAITRGDSGASIAGELGYNGNRFAALLEHQRITNSGFGGVRSQETSLTIGTQIAFAGDSFAIGRPVGPRFAIVSAHSTIEDATVNVRQGPGRDNPQARTDFLGAALAPAGNAYTPNQLRIDVDNLPVGYDIGPGQYDVVPGPTAGYAITVGSDASRVIIGTAVDAAGAPVSLQGGSIRSLDNPNFQPVLLFKNRGGRFVANGLAPGRYEIDLGGPGAAKGNSGRSDKCQGHCDGRYGNIAGRKPVR